MSLFLKRTPVSHGMDSTKTDTRNRSNPPHKRPMNSRCLEGEIVCHYSKLTASTVSSATRPERANRDQLQVIFSNPNLEFFFAHQIPLFIARSSVVGYRTCMIPLRYRQCTPIPVIHKSKGFTPPPKTAAPTWESR